MAARAALLPGAPCTPPPGWADAEPRKRPRTGVSARPQPGTGRNTSCWCSCDVPPLMAPPTRLASSSSSCRGPKHPAGQDPRPEARSEALEPALHAVGEPLAVGVVPDAPDALATGVVDALLRDVRVGPQRLRAGGRAGRVGRRHLAHQQERVGGHVSRRDLRERVGDLLGRVGDVHRPGRVRRRRRPRHGPVERPVDLHRRGVQLEATHRPRGRGRQVLGPHQAAVQLGSPRRRRRRRAEPAAPGRRRCVHRWPGPARPAPGRPGSRRGSPRRDW